jgi:hypothetical protein
MMITDDCTALLGRERGAPLRDSTNMQATAWMTRRSARVHLRVAILIIAAAFFITACLGQGRRKKLDLGATEYAYHVSDAIEPCWDCSDSVIPMQVLGVPPAGSDQRRVTQDDMNFAVLHFLFMSSIGAHVNPHSNHPAERQGGFPRPIGGYQWLWERAWELNGRVVVVSTVLDEYDSTVRIKVVQEPVDTKDSSACISAEWKFKHELGSFYFIQERLPGQFEVRPSISGYRRYVASGRSYRFVPSRQPSEEKFRGELSLSDREYLTRLDDWLPMHLLEDFRFMSKDSDPLIAKVSAKIVHDVEAWRSIRSAATRSD